MKTKLHFTQEIIMRWIETMKERWKEPKPEKSNKKVNV